MKQIWFLSVLFIGAKTSTLENDAHPENLVIKEGEPNEGMEVSKNAIVGGTYARIERVPYLAQLYINDFQLCGASIISLRWLITAAHCLVKKNKKHLKVITSSTFQGQGQFHDVEQIISHENYDPVSSDNDIALIKLTKVIEFNEEQQPIKIATKYPNPGDLLQISGFGKENTNADEISHILKTAFVPVIGQKRCRNAYKNESANITGNMFCAGVAGKIDSCEGDSGGPAVINGKLVGIVSWGMECASTRFPGVYTQLLNYREWIRSYTTI